MSDSDRAYDRLHGVDGHTQAEHGPTWDSDERPSCRCGFNGTPEECTASRAADASEEALVGPDGFTRLTGYVAEYVNDSVAALRVQVVNLTAERDEYARRWEEDARPAFYRAEQAEARLAAAKALADEAEYHIEQLRDARDCAERALERLQEAAHRVGHQAACPVAPCDCWMQDLAPLLGDETECSGLCGEHHWLDRPESDTRECLICGTEVAG